MATYKYRVKVITGSDVEQLQFEPVDDAPLVTGLCQRDPSRFGRVTDGIVVEKDPGKREATFGAMTGATKAAAFEEP